MDKIQIILEAVERAKGVLNQTIAEISKLDAQNKKSEGTWQRLNKVLKEHDRVLLGVKLASAAFLAATALMVRSALTTADSYLKLAAAAGTTVEKFSTLAFAAKQSNVDVDALGLGLKQIQISAVAAAQGSTEQAAAYKALGIAVKNADGTVKDSVSLLLEVSDAYARAQDGPIKAAIAQRLFGRSSHELILFLNQGSTAIREQQQQARALGLEISTNTAVAADKFSDNMNALKGVLQGMANQIVAKLLPVLLQFQQFLLRNPDQIKALVVVMLALATAVTAATVAFKAYAAAAAIAEVLAVSTAAVGVFAAAIVALTLVVVAGVEAWKLYRAKQDEALSVDSLQGQQQKMGRLIKLQIDDLHKLGKVTEDEAAKLKAKLDDSLNVGSDKEISETQAFVRNRLRVLKQLEPLHAGATPGAPGAAGGAKNELVLPDIGLAKARSDATAALFKASLDAEEQEFGDSQRARQAVLDEALKRRTIALDDWRTQQRALDEAQVKISGNLENKRFNIQRDNLAATLALSSDPKEQATLNGQIQALEIEHQQKISSIKADGEQKRFDTEQRFSDQRQARIELEFQESQQREADAATELKSKEAELATPGAIGAFESPLLEANKAKDEYLLKLQDEQVELQGILNKMHEINDASPGAVPDRDLSKVTTAIKKNAAEQVDTERKKEEAKLKIREQVTQGTIQGLGDLATITKAFGKEGFAAFKALSIAQAVVSTAAAAIGAYQSAVHIPYIGWIIAPIAAAAAVAAGAVQIANIQAQHFATGGLVQGAGTGTSDSVPVMASRGEFINREAVVSQPGALEFLRNFNQLGMSAIDGAIVQAGPRSARFASGGLVGDAMESSQTRQTQGGAIAVGFIETRNHLRRFMASEGTRILVDSMQRRGNQVVA